MVLKVLKIGEKLIDKTFNNQELTIICKGDNVIEGCMFSNINNNNLEIILIEGENVVIKNNRFQEIKKIEKIIMILNNNNVISNNLFIFISGLTVLIEIKSYYNLITRNRIENVKCDKLIYIMRDSNIIYSNEIISCLGNLHIGSYNNIIANNKIDYKNKKESVFIKIYDGRNIIKCNEIKNCEKIFDIYTEKKNFIDNNVFISCNNIYNTTKSQHIENNNYVSCDYKNNNPKEKVNYEYIMYVNKNKSIIYHEIKTEIDNLSIKYKEKEKVKEINKNCCCNELKKFMKAQTILAEYKDLNNRMRKCLIKMEKLLR